jgi:hypothetical protein
MDKYRSEWQTFWKGTVYSGTDMLSSILREPKCYPTRLVDFAQIDMDTHTNEILTFRTPNIILMWIPVKLARSICFTNFDGLNVTKATWIPLKVILP